MRSEHEVRQARDGIVNMIKTLRGDSRVIDLLLLRDVLSWTLGENPRSDHLDVDFHSYIMQFAMEQSGEMPDG